jgi:hypothetical protein
MPRKPTEQPTAPKLTVLSSYAYLRDEPAAVERLFSSPGVETLLDCGAFTAKNAGAEIDLGDYIDFVTRHRGRLFGYIALDKIQDPKQTEINLRAMLAEGLEPIPVHVLGDDGRRMDELFELSRWVALGGLRRPQRGPAPYPYVKQKMAWARGRDVHWLGFTNKPMLEAFRPYSCDCSSWVAGAMYGRLQIYLGSGSWLTCTREEALAGRVHLREDVRRALHFYEIEIGDFLDERHWHNGNRKAELKASECVITQLPARSWVRYVIDFRRRFGTRFFLACHGNQVPWLLEAFEIVRRKIVDENNSVRDDGVRGLPQVGGCTGGGRVPAHTPPPRVPRQGGERGAAR